MKWIRRLTLRWERQDEIDELEMRIRGLERWRRVVMDSIAQNAEHLATIRRALEQATAHIERLKADDQ